MDSEFIKDDLTELLERIFNYSAAFKLFIENHLYLD